MACNKSFSDNYMVLTQEDASFFDLVRILFNSDIEKRRFVACPAGGREERFKYRWLIFVSVLVQKFLQFVGKPLAWFGSVVEMWINLLSSNRNFFVLLWNFLQGQC